MRHSESHAWDRARSRLPHVYACEKMKQTRPEPPSRRLLLLTCNPLAPIGMSQVGQSQCFAVCKVRQVKQKQCPHASVEGAAIVPAQSAQVRAEVILARERCMDLVA